MIGQSTGPTEFPRSGLVHGRTTLRVKQFLNAKVFFGLRPVRQTGPSPPRSYSWSWAGGQRRVVGHFGFSILQRNNAARAGVCEPTVRDVLLGARDHDVCADVAESCKTLDISAVGGTHRVTTSNGRGGQKDRRPWRPVASERIPTINLALHERHGLCERVCVPPGDRGYCTRVTGRFAPVRNRRFRASRYDARWSVPSHDRRSSCGHSSPDLRVTASVMLKRPPTRVSPSTTSTDNPLPQGNRQDRGAVTLKTSI